MPIRTSEALARAIAQAPAHASLTLAAGSFRLPTDWTVTRPITLVGQGNGATRLLGHLTAEADVTLMELAIAGEVSAPVIHMRSGHLALSGCRLSGGLRGLSLTGHATAEVRDAKLVGHRHDGVRVDDAAQAALSRCLIERNGGDGVAVGGAATLTIENSLVLDNRGCGVAFRETATGEAYGNLMQGHRGADLVVSGLATPRLAQNTVPEPEPVGLVRVGVDVA